LKKIKFGFCVFPGGGCGSPRTRSCSGGSSFCGFGFDRIDRISLIDDNNNNFAKLGSNGCLVAK
jgi:hypothetical protein